MEENKLLLGEGLCFCFQKEHPFFSLALFLVSYGILFGPPLSYKQNLGGVRRVMRVSETGVDA